MQDVLTGRTEPKGCQYITGRRGGVCRRAGRWYRIKINAEKLVHAFRCHDHTPNGSGPGGPWSYWAVQP